MKFAKSWLTVGLLLTMTAGCKTTKEVEVIDTACITFSPIYTTLRDVQTISDMLARQILTHNNKYQKLCLEEPSDHK